MNNTYNIIGITLEEFYNSDIIYMSLSEFNNISINLLKKYTDNILIIWLDTKYHNNNKNLHREIKEAKYVEQKIKDFNYMYFLNENYNEISNIILNYLKNVNYRDILLKKYE